MRPETLHLIATVIRHARGMINAVEKFERTVPREDRAAEVRDVITFVREVMTSADRTLYTAPPE